MYSYNLGYAMAAKELGIDVLTVKSEQGCDTCSKETSIDLTQPNYVARIPIPYQMPVCAYNYIVECAVSARDRSVALLLAFCCFYFQVQQ